MSDYNRIIVLENSDEEMDRVVKERAETSQRKDDKEDISRAKVHVFKENTRPMIDRLGDPNKAVKVHFVRYNMTLLCLPICPSWCIKSQRRVT